jgi:hypothetical protein
MTIDNYDHTYVYVICIGRTAQYLCTKLVIHKLSKYN